MGIILMVIHTLVPEGATSMGSWAPGIRLCSNRELSSTASHVIHGMELAVCFPTHVQFCVNVVLNGCS